MSRTSPCRETRWRALWSRIVPIVACLTLVAPTAFAHPPLATVATLRIDTDGHVDLTVHYDALAFALNDVSANIPDEPMFELLHAGDDAIAQSLAACGPRFEQLCILEADSNRIPLSVATLPTVADVRAEEARRPTYPLPIKSTLESHAQLTASTSSITIRFPEILGIVVVTIDRPGFEPVAIPLGVNERSPAFKIIPIYESGSTTQPEPPAAGDSNSSRWQAFLRFVSLGFRHIVPEGQDHMLFVLGLFLLTPKARPVLLQISAFTLAHTVTLALTSLRIIGLPASIVEPAIAASIAFAGIENLVITRVTPWRTLAAFIFGLVHGMGVATSFNEAGFPEGTLVSSLVAFTLGVEGGHLAVLLAAFVLLGWTRNRAWYRPRIAIPLSLVISAIAIVWFVQRLR
ncbi:MAG: HupE/UreJ family protein [Phycisphaerales bacterium]|nr:MAG: HupE/UreJ family protein [Phycisphaerales bacterium]